MNRSEHLQWCKDRANAYIDSNDMQPSFTNFISDMGKHPETENHLALGMGMPLLLSGHLATAKQMRDWINGFN